MERIPMPVKRRCEFCGKPLPPDSAPQRRFHDSCRQKRYMAKLFEEAGRKRKSAA